MQVWGNQLHRLDQFKQEQEHLVPPATPKHQHQHQQRQHRNYNAFMKATSPMAAATTLHDPQYLYYNNNSNNNDGSGGSNNFTPGSSGTDSLVPYPDRAFPCLMCTYRATTKGNLAMHLRTHTGEKPYKCSHCSYASAFKQNLGRHIKQTHPVTNDDHGSVFVLPTLPTPPTLPTLDTQQKRAF